MLRQATVVVLLLVAAAAAAAAADFPAADETDEPHTRVKRYYGYGYDYYGCGGGGGWFCGDYWYAGRTIGVIVGVLLLLLCCCIPCICIAGIWFLGWFGIKAARDGYAARGGIGGYGSDGSAAAAATSSSAAAAAPTAIPISTAPEPAPRTTFAEEAQNHRSYASDSHAPPPRRFESTSRRRDSDDFDVVFEAEDHFYSQSTHHSPRDTYPYRSSRF